MLGSSIIAGNKPDKEISVPPNAFTEQRLENILIRQSQFESSRKKKTEKKNRKSKPRESMLDAPCSRVCQYFVNIIINIEIFVECASFSQLISRWFNKQQRNR